MEGEKCRVSDPVPVGYTIYGFMIGLIYRILGNFRGTKFSRIGAFRE